MGAVLIRPKRDFRPRQPGRLLVLAATAIAYIATAWATIPTATLLPVIARDLGMEPDLAGWVLTVYLIVLITFLLPAGRLGDLYGHRRLFVAGALCAGAATLLIVVTPGVASLLILRAVQGAGSALVLGTAVALLASAYSADQRGRAIGMLSMVSMLGGLLGTFFVAYVAEAFSWRWTFVVPALLFLISALIGMARKQDQDLSEGTDRRSAHRLIPAEAFRNRYLTAAVGANVALHLGMMGITVLIPFLVREAMGLPLGFTAVALLPLQLGGTLLAPVSGWLSDRRQDRWILPGAMLALAIALVALAWAAESGAAFSVVVGISALLGLAQGLFSTANNVRILNASPDHLRGLANGLIELSRQFGHSLGTTIAAAMLTVSFTLPGSGTTLSGFSTAAIMMAGIAAVGVGTTLLPKR